ISYNQTAPLAPANLSATTVSSSEVGLTWQDNSDDETGFKIERKTANSAFSEIATSGPNTNSYTNSGLTPSTTYIYRVFAYNASGNSSYSNQDSATTANIEPVEYYIDAINGNDGNNGLAPSTAWKTLAKVNATTFGPSNKILFKAGGVWVGRLYPKGSGISGNPIIIDMYGTGNKPLIDGNGLTGTGVVYLYNQQYWEINNLEITNNASSGGDRRGVRIEAENYGTANHIYLKNLNIHNIKGSVGQNRSDKRTGGIGFGIVDVSTQETHFNDILVENCVITSCENQGIITECVTDDGFDPYSAEWNSMKITNAVIRNNTISVISKNAMIIRLFEGGVIENNVCFNTANGISGNTIFSAACSGTVFQYNEGYDNNSPDADGSMYDADLRSPNTYWQYSYSHDNAHGLFWTCTVQADANVVCRYNISQNDQGIIFCINYPVTSVRIYNNTVYIPSNLSPVIISERNNGGSGSRTYTFYNNLIYNQSSTASYDWTSGYSRTIDYNCFYGVHPSTEPADPHKVTTDPKLVNAGSGGIGINSVGGYKLQSGSSCINKGKTISDNGGRDYWGNPLYNGLADIGANEYTLPPIAPTNLIATVILPAQISLAWTDNS
ncbi:MAG: fibronectin type III domain-containing protein, partial [Bacteroidales bacterium]